MVSRFSLDVTWLSYITAAVVCYYVVLVSVCALGANRRTRGHHAAGYEPMVVLVIPAHNEQAVIETTLRSLDRLTFGDRLILVMDDGSTDATSRIVAGFQSSNDVRLIRRTGAQAGRGKGAVLNHAYRMILELLSDDSALAGRSPSEVIVGVMDADGQLEPDTLDQIVPYFKDPAVGAVQIGVRIANASDSVLARMQDLEFVGFSGLVQNARNAFGSVGLGGNGQFTRLSALVDLHREPWTDCLSEDLDLSLSLVRAGAQVRFCPTTYVAQQGLTHPGRLLRQRARWVQGHYQCWRHIPGLLLSRRVQVRTKIDLSLYLLMISFVLVITAGTALTMGSLLGIVTITNSFLAFIPDGALHNGLAFLLSFGPALGFVYTYQRRARTPFRLWELPAYTAAFCLYAYHWVFAHIWALTRIALRRRGWIKTPRIPATVAG